ncbi:hypothetical protein AAMO2058_001199600 [Amorphochlora amoebiformis]
MEDIDVSLLNERARRHMEKWKDVPRLFAGINKLDATKLWVSNSVRDILGYHPNEFLSLPGWQTLHPDDRNMFATTYKRANPGTPNAKGFAVGCRLKRKDGRFIPMVIAEEIVGELIFSLEIPIESQIQQAVVPLKQEYIAKTAHNLKTPLTALQYAADVLDKSPLMSDQSKVVKSIKATVSWMNMITNQSICTTLKQETHSSMQGGSEKINFVSISNAVKTLLSGHSRGWNDKDVTISEDIDQKIAKVEFNGDSSWIVCILANLQSNAMKFTTKGSIKTEIFPIGPMEKIKSPKPTFRRRICIQVRDTGSGISKEMKQTMFQPFTKENSHESGFGLGLHSVQHIAEQLDGKVFCGENTEDRRGGSIVGVEIMLTYSMNENENDSASPRTKSKRKFHVLLVDDSPLILKLMSKSLSKMGCVVDTAVNGMEGLKRIQSSMVAGDKKKYDLVFSDIDMPVMDGFEMCKSARLEGFTGRIVGMSAMEVLNSDSYASRFDYHIPKPIPRRVLKLAIENCIPLKYFVKAPEKPRRPASDVKKIRWYFYDERKKLDVGPFELSPFQALRRIGPISGQTLVRNSSMPLNKWKPAKSFKDLEAALRLEKKKRKKKQERRAETAVIQTAVEKFKSLLGRVKLKDFIKKCPCCWMGVDAGGMVVMANESMKKTLELCEKDILGFNVSRFIQDESGWKYKESHAHLRKTRGKFTHVSSYETKSGKKLQFDWHGVYVDEGFIVMWARLLDKPNQTRKILNSQLTTINSLRTALNEFTHDVRTPLHGLINIWKHLCEDVKAMDANLQEELRQQMDDGLICINQLLTLATSKLALTKLSGTGPAVNLLAHLESIKVTLDRSANPPTFEMINVPDPGRILQQDAIWLFQIITNLVNNSRSQKPDVHVRVKISHTASNGQNELQIIVADNGQGLPQEYVDFVTGITSTVQGRGLGLRIVKSVASLMGGSVKYRNNNGAEFTVRVKLTTLELSTSPSSSEGSCNPKSIKDSHQDFKFKIDMLKGAKVMAVEDCSVNLRLLQRMLKNKVKSICLKNLASLAVKEIQRGIDCNVILTDIGMPPGEMDGIEATRRIRLAGFKGAIIGLTGHSDPKIIELARETGMDQIVSKPFTKEKLYRSVAMSMSRLTYKLCS